MHNPQEDEPYGEYEEQDMTQQSDELATVLWKLQRLAEPNGLTTADVRWATEQIEVIITQQTQEAYKKGYIDGGIGVING